MWFAGVPVSDVITRLGYKRHAYGEFSIPHWQNTRGRCGRIPPQVPGVACRQIADPLLIHTNTNDEEVNSVEVEHMIQALKAEGKSFDYTIFENHPGGHSFDRMDMPEASAIRLDIYRFLAKYLKPPRPFRNVRELRNAAYQPWNTPRP